MTHLAPAGSATPATRQHHASSTIESFLVQLYGTRRGFVELAYIIGDPSDKDACQFRREFWAFPNDTQRIRTRIAELGRRYGNVYLSANLYQQPSRNSTVLPGRVVFVDDAPLDLSCTFSVRTSPSSKHAYFLLDQDAPGETLRDLARRAAYALGGDKSGWDSQQLVRVPGTFNTKAKHGGRFPVALQPESGQTYTVEQLRALWPAVAAPSAAQVGHLHWPEVERWLGNLSALVGADGLPRRVKPTTQTGRVLSGVVTGDSSLDRYIVTRGLVMHGYPNDEAAALLWHYCAYGKSEAKGSAWLSADIARVLAKVRSEQPGIVPSPTRYRASAPAQPLPQVERPKRGRKIALTPAKLLDFYTVEAAWSDVLLLTVSEVAERLHVSRATIERCERTLRAEGAIERRHFNRRQSSLVAILRPVTTTEDQNLWPAPAVEIKEPADQRPVTTTGISATPLAEHVPSQQQDTAQQDAKKSTSIVVEGTHPPAASPHLLGPVLPVIRVSPRTAVAEAFAHFAHCKRITRQRLVMFLESKYPELRVAPQALDRLIQAERSRRVWEHQIASLGTMPYAKLAYLSRKIDRILTDGVQGREQGQHGWACALSPYVATEMERRAALNERADPHRIRRQHAEYLALVENDRYKQRDKPAPRAKTPTLPQAGPSGRVCSPNNVSIQHELFGNSDEPRLTAVGLVERLRQRKLCQREGG